MGWLIFAGILLLLAVLPLGVWARYDADGPLVRIVAGPLRITVFPAKKKETAKQKPVKSDPRNADHRSSVGKQGEESLPQAPQKPKQTPQKPKEKGGSLMDFIPLVKVAFAFLGGFRRKLRIEQLYLRLIMASSDPCDLAVNYGRAWAAVGNLMPQLERLVVIQKRDVEVECDFLADQTLVNAQVKITITLGRLLSLVAVYGFRAAKEFIAIKKKRKGGAVT